MNLLTAAIGTALAYAGDLPRALVRGALDHVVDRGLELLASVRPWRVVARQDYILRYYLGGRVGHAFPEETRALLGSLDGTAYLHRIGSPDSGRAHHSHPWEWAVSIVLTGGYVEEIVNADGTIITRTREPGSVAVITADTYHRIAELGAAHVWTLFIVGPRTPDRAWFFRRPNGSIVHEVDYHANLEAERAAEEAWVNAAHAAKAFVDALPMAKMGGRGVKPADIKRAAVEQWDEWCSRGWIRNDAELTVERSPNDENRFDIKVPLSFFGKPIPASEAVDPSIPISEAAAEAAAKLDEFIKPGRSGVIAGSPESMPEAVAAMEALGWRMDDDGWMAHEDGREIRLTATLAGVRGSTSPVWLHGGTDDMLCAVAPLAMAGGPVVISEAATKPLPAAPEGYRFEPVDAPSIIIRRGDFYVGSLMTSGRAVAHGRQLPPAEVKKHAEAWAHARAMRREGGSR